MEEARYRHIQQGGKKAALEQDEKRKISDNWMNKRIDKPEVKRFLIKKICTMSHEWRDLFSSA